MTLLITLERYRNSLGRKYLQRYVATRLYLTYSSKFVSPIMFPNSETLPMTALAISPITSSAHPTMQNLSCALTHPNDPSCSRPYLTFFLRAFPSVVRYFSILFGAFSLLRIQA